MGQSPPLPYGSRRLCPWTDDIGQFITLSVYVWVQLDAPATARCTGPSAAADTCQQLNMPIHLHCCLKYHFHYFLNNPSRNRER